ncbi:hypothetical protein PTR02_05850 [Serratia nevei]|uniref:RHS repeat-associated core domain-containing protein n=1 Tax=Serratia TaxID=613 RepID=UPI001CDC1C94|nr:RHS repeat-associated core domain-containing protein [Serratia marcescens]MCA4109126.1 hypothetical protein [Serratia marcescens]
MSDDSAFFTQASNFISAVSGGVDPRTGLYGINITLGQLVANDRRGPVLPLSLSYSPLNTTDIGFGIGFALGLSSYHGDAQSGLLTLATGERYQVIDGGIQQKKLDNFRFDMSEDNYRILHKDGSVELLGQIGGFCVPSQIFTPSGNNITLHWDVSCGPLRLSNITDETGISLLTLEYTGNSAVLHVLPDQTEGYDVWLTLDNEYHLTELWCNGLGEKDTSLTWNIGYDLLEQSGNSWGPWATSLTWPGGLRESVTYLCGDNAQRFPEGAGFPPLPCVSSITTADMSFSQTQQYDYSDHNFLGYGSSIGWEAQQDNLYSAASDYKYSSTQTYTDDAGVQTTTVRTYNNYHLLESQVTTRNDCVTAQLTEYHIAQNATFDVQPSNYQLPKTTTTTWTRGSGTSAKTRSEITSTTFDDSGNPLKKSTVSKDGSGVCTPIGTDIVWTYYPAGGETADAAAGTGCPAEPNGFIRFIKTMTATPRLTGGYKSPEQVTTYAYVGMETPDDAKEAISLTIMKSRETHCRGKQLLANYDYFYSDKQDKTNGFGRLIKTVDIHYPSGKEGKTYQTTNGTAYTLNAADNALIQTDTLLTHDGLSLTHQQRLSRFTGRVWETVDALGVKDVMEYDMLGRMTKIITAKNTDYENTRTWVYDINADNSTPFSITATDANHNQVRTGYNGAGKMMSTDVCLADDLSQSWKTLKTGSYDSLLRPTSVTNSDYLPMGSGNLESKASQNLSSTLSYDDWGLQHHVATSHDLLHYRVTDPIAMTITAYTVGKNNVRSATTVTRYNLNWVAVQIDVYNNTKDPTAPDFAVQSADSTTSAEFDGLNQLRRQTDELGRVTAFDYDPFGRIAATTLPKVYSDSISAGTQIIRIYSEASPSAWLSDIQVAAENETKSGARGAPVSMGTQDFDGLGRVTSRTSGGRTWTASYSAGTKLKEGAISPGSLHGPDSLTSPNNNRVNYGYIAALGGKLAFAQSAALPQRKEFTYDRATGKLKTAKVKNGSQVENSITNTYTPSGRLSAELFSQATVAAKYTYTAAGEVTSYTDVTKIVQSVTSYDGFGRQTGVSDKDVMITLGYDELDRPNQWVSKDLFTEATLTTTVQWDNLGREKLRTVTSNQSAHSWTLESEWYSNAQVKTKMLKRGGQAVRTENYSYDPRNRLTDYSASGSELPQDEQGNQITSQSFSYDAYGNITSVQSTFADGSKDTLACTYNNPADPCQLTQATHTHPSYETTIPMKYDLNGMLTDDGMGASARTLNYYSSVQEGRLSSATRKLKDASSQSTVYQYDAMGRLIQQDETTLHYRGTTLVNQQKAGDEVRLITGPGGNLAQIRTGVNPGVWLTGTDANGSVLSIEQDARQDQGRYDPYGQSINNPGGSVLGYNGERQDEILGGYHLGNGYRLYNPYLKRFSSPDSLSPFGKGGINPYAYCEGDPINHTDPTGHHVRWQAIVGGVASVIGLGLAATFGGPLAVAGALLAVTSAGTNIASQAESNSHPETSRILGWVSLGTGAASAAVGVGAAVQDVGGSMERTLTDNPRTRGRIEGGVAEEHVNIDYHSGSEENPRAWDDSIRNENGTYLMASNRVINADYVKDAVNFVSKANDKDIVILSGSHGTSRGVNWEGSYRRDSLIVRQFGREDRSLSLGNSRVSVRNLSRISTSEYSRIVNSTDKNVILGYCFSRNDVVLRDARNLRPVTSWYVGRRQFDDYLTDTGQVWHEFI